MTASATPRHLRLTGPHRSDPAALVAALGLPPLLASVSAHRRLRGPYTAAGSFVRSVVPDALRRMPDLVARHDIEILTVAPELRSALTCDRETLTSLASPQERTRFYPRARTTRIAHGLTEFVAGYLQQRAEGPRTLIVADVDAADTTDTEWLAILVRRTDPALLRIVVCGHDGLPDALIRHTAPVPAAAAPPVEWPARSDADAHSLAAAFVAAECLSRDPRLREAYEALPAGQRAALHDARAAEVEASDEPTLRLGAIPFHAERGSDPAVAARALRAALEHCVLMGFYDAVLDLGDRSFAVLDWDSQPEECWLVTAKVTTALTALERPDEAAELYDEACARSTLPSVHLQAAYGRAMLYTRFYDRPRQDQRKAKAWINTAIAISSVLPDEQRRAFNLTFNENGLALIEMHLGDLAEALRLVTAGLDRLDAELGPDEQTLHRSVLRYNRAQLLAAMRRVDDAIAEYTRAIHADPHHSEYYFERAGLYRRAGRVADAFADYEAATRLSPPYPEPYYNRGDLAMEVGDLDTALADFTYVLELDPEFADAYVNRAGIRFELGDLAGAAADVEAGLRLDGNQPHLHCLRGLIAQEQGRFDQARAAFDTALELDPSLTAALAARAALAFDAGDVEESVDDLTRALGIGEDPTLRANRALAYERLGEWRAAAEDCTKAIDGGASDEDVLQRRARCLLRAGDREPAA
jgi:tetratricopeptide (TPR) repeat protein